MPERRVTYQVVAQGQLNGISLSAPSWQRLFVDAGLALNDFRISLDLVRESQKETLSVSGATLPELMAEWLNAVAGLFTEKRFLAYRIVFTHFDGKKIEATLTGETYEPTRHGYARPFQRLADSGLRLEASGSDGSEFSATFYLS